jgi:Uma2 family endonuclease
MSTAIATETRYTPEDLLGMPDGVRYELVDGQLVERNLGAESSLVGGELHFRMRLHYRDHGSGLVFPADNGYQCFPYDSGRVRKPEVSFVRRGRLPGDVAPEGWVTIPADLAVEVVSPNDRVYELEEKLDDYRKARVPLVWVIHPKLRRATVYRADGLIRLLFENDELSGEDVIPGFRCVLREILPQKLAEEAQPAPAGPNGAG